MKHRGWVALSGLIWFFIGGSLLFKGLNFISEAAFKPDSLCSRLSEKPQMAATMLIAIGLLIGFFKGRFVLSKTVKRVVSRIASLPLPIRLKDAYSPSYWLIIAFMMALGMSFRFLPIPLEIRGTIDIAIGSALINGAMLYFRACRSIYGIDSPVQSP